MIDRARLAVGPEHRVILDLTRPARFSVPHATAGSVGGTLRVIDLRDPLSEGLYRFVGRSPSTASGPVVAISAALAARLGVGIGDEVAIVPGEQRARITDIVVYRPDTSALFLVRPPTADAVAAVMANSEAGNANSLVAVQILCNHVDGSALQALDTAGFSYLTRERLLESTKRYAELVDRTVPATGILALALCEVGLIVGAAMTVSARRRARDLGLLAAAGAPPSVRRAVVVMYGLVIGVLGAASSLPLGLGLAMVGSRLVQRAVHQEWEELRLDPALAAAGPGLAFAVCVLAAWLTGRRGATAAPIESLRLAALPAPRPPGRIPFIVGAAGAIAACLGAISREPVPLVVATALGTVALLLAMPLLLARLTTLGRSSLAARMAVRDLRRDRARAVALACAVAGPFVVVVVATSLIGSQAVIAKRSYVPTGPIGTTTLLSREPAPAEQIGAAASILGAAHVGRATALGIRVELTGSAPTVVPTVADNATLRCVEAGPSAQQAEAESEIVEECQRRNGGLGPFPAVAQADRAFAEVVLGRELTDAEARAFKQGVGLVIDPRIEVKGGALSLRPIGFRSGAGAPAAGGSRHVIRALSVGARPVDGLPVVLIAEKSFVATGLRPIADTATVFTGPSIPSEQAEDRARAVLSSGDGTSTLSVERGPEGERLLLRVLAVVAGALLIATIGVIAIAVALSSQQLRQDFATLAAIGAQPQVRRRIAATQAALLAASGVSAGALIGSLGAAALAWASHAPVWPQGLVVVAAVAAVSVVSAGVLGGLSAPRHLVMGRRDA